MRIRGNIQEKICRNRDCIGYCSFVFDSAGAPFGQLPVLEVDGVIMGQSMTIARYLAKKFGLAGATDMEHALADMYVDSVSDLFTAYIPIFYESDAAKKAQMLSDLVNKNIVPHVTRVESQLEKNGGLYLVGKSVRLS